MQKLKNKKRLTAVVIVFLLTFMVGAAFAATPGALQTTGTIGIGEPTDPELHVIWTNATPVANLAVAEVNSAIITTGAAVFTLPGQPDQPAMGPFTANHRVNWFVGFNSAGTVTLNMVAQNVGTLPASVSRPTGSQVGALAWFDDDPDFVDIFTVTVLEPQATSGNAPLAWPIVLQPNETVNVQVTLAWDGTIPPGLFSAIQAASFPPVWGPGNVFAQGEVLYGYEWTNSFVFSLPYVLAP